MTKLKYTLKTAINSLLANKSRSALTILGIVIGITAIIIMMSVGRGAEDLIVGEISGLGSNTLVVRPGREPSGLSDFSDTLFSDSLKERDLEALKKKSNVPELVDIMPAVAVPGLISYKGETYGANGFGGSAEFFAKSFDIYPDKGRLFDETEIQSRASVAIIGYKVKEELFGGEEAIGKNIKLKDRNFRVVGVFPKRGNVAFINFDEIVIIPYTTAQTYLLGISHFNEFIVRTTGPETVAETVRDIELTLRATHGLEEGEENDFYMDTSEALAEQVQSILGALTAFLSSVVAVALVVGGVGIMNIMLVSVAERTREIGLRKAVGATQKNIRNQFLIEAIMLTAVGGVIGVLLGALVSFLISIAIRSFTGLDWVFSFPISAVFLGIGASTLVGLVFGVYPAKEASKRSPIEALRYE